MNRQNRQARTQRRSILTEAAAASSEAVLMLIVATPLRGNWQIKIRSEDANMDNNHLMAHAAVELTGTCPICHAGNDKAGYVEA